VFIDHRDIIFFFFFRIALVKPKLLSTMTDRKAVIKNADMSEDMQQDAGM
jgi:hypothetical protein